MSKISIPPIDEFRKHLLFTCLYVHAHSLLSSIGKVPSFGVEKMIDSVLLKDFMNRITNAGTEDKLEIDEDDVVLNYTSMLYVTRLLLSPYDELIMNEILLHFPDSNTWGSFDDFRKNMIGINSFLLKDTEEKFPGLSRLFIIKETISEMVFE